jgi:hypothetical protein
MNWTAATHLGYLLIAVPLTIWVARTLSRNGRVFLKDVFHEQEDLADAVNTLLVVGFYLLNVGFVLLYLRGGDAVASSTQLLESLSRKIGVVMVMLGLVHFCNVYVFNAIRRRSRLEAMRTPPVPPQGWLMPQPPAPLPPR